MPYHAIKTSVLSGAVPTDGVMYYVGGGKWSNQYDDRKLFDTEDAGADNEAGTFEEHDDKLDELEQTV